VTSNATTLSTDTIETETSSAENDETTSDNGALDTGIVIGIVLLLILLIIIIVAIGVVVARRRRRQSDVDDAVTSYNPTPTPASTAPPSERSIYNVIPSKRELNPYSESRLSLGLTPSEYDSLHIK
jgi:heme/copper-type cytochrome/quinol oxidase subunit 2